MVTKSPPMGVERLVCIKKLQGLRMPDKAVAKFPQVSLACVTVGFVCIGIGMLISS